MDGAVALGAGVLHALSIAPLAVWPLQFLALALLCRRLWTAKPARAAALGLVFGTAWLCCSVWWLFISMHRYGGLPAPLAALAVLVLCLALSLYLAAALALWAHWRRGLPGWDALLLGALWLLVEWARAVWFTGFPWAAAGYAHLDGPLAALTPWVGVYGMGWVAASLSAWLAFGWVARPRQGRPTYIAAALLLALAALPTPQFTQSTGTLSVRLIQTNVAQDEKFALERMPEALAWLAQALAQSPAEMTVAPETAIPLLPAQLKELAPGYWSDLLTAFASPGRAALVGIALGDEASGYANAVLAWHAGAADYRYDKSHLVPFGEFIPTGFRWFTTMMNIPLGDFNRGAPNAPSFEFRGQRLAPNICYEDLFGEELALRFADAATAPTILVNLSNIGWFGDSIAVAQHLNVSRLRALELQRPMLRATNTGATAVIDHLGQVRSQLPSFTRAHLDATVEGRQGNTPFAVWASRAGLWPLVLLALVLMALCRRR